MNSKPSWKHKKHFRELISKIGINKIEGSSTKQGCLYHELPFFSNIPTHRKSSKLRADIIKSNLGYDLTNKTGLDLGCSVGGITFELQLAGANMVGIDYDPNAINLAKEIEKYYNTGALFRYQLITYSLIFGLQEFDFIVWLNQWMWLAKQLYKERGNEIVEVKKGNFSGFFILTSKSIWSRVGGFKDQGSGLGGIDLDYCKRIKTIGCKLYVMPGLYFYHLYKYERIF